MNHCWKLQKIHISKHINFSLFDVKENKLFARASTRVVWKYSAADYSSFDNGHFPVYFCNQGSFASAYIKQQWLQLLIPLFHTFVSFPGERGEESEADCVRPHSTACRTTLGSSYGRLTTEPWHDLKAAATASPCDASCVDATNEEGVKKGQNDISIL